MNIRIVLTFFTWQAVTLFALGSLISQTTNCSDCKSSPSIPETLSSSSSDGGKEPEESRMGLEATTSSKIATTITDSTLKLHTITPLVSAGVNASTRTSTKKPNSTKISLEDDHLVFIALMLIALTLLSVALVLWLLIRKYRAENRRSLRV